MEGHGIAKTQKCMNPAIICSCDTGQQIHYFHNLLSIDNKVDLEYQRCNLLLSFILTMVAFQDQCMLCGDTLPPLYM